MNKTSGFLGKSWALALLFAAVVLSACASGKPSVPGAPDDAGPSFDADVRIPFGGDCEEDSQCLSGVCLETDDGKWCSQTCSQDCPLGYACSQDLCIPSVEILCKSCQTDTDCGGQNNRCISYDGGLFCASDCSGDGNTCPTGFSCTLIDDEQNSQDKFCKSDSDVCCIDKDGDSRGQGGECRATDCDDTDPDIYDDAEELCDGKDNDCTGGIDVDVTDCNEQECRLSSDSYVMRADAQCTSGACVDAAEVSCGLYACDGGGDLGDSCATTCDVESDGKCHESAHCDDSLCFADLVDSGVCNEDSDCQSGHCQNGFCCSGGDCCAVASDCPSFGSFDPVCESPASCQGSRGAAVCSGESTCGTTGVEQDDSACTALTLANDCGLFKPIFCNGNAEQTAPLCPSTCVSNSDCDANAFCESGTQVCVEKVVDGQNCTDDSQCQADHCSNGFCCQGGDCCESASDCPGQYSSDPVCTVSSACQGRRDLAQCIDFSCGTFNNADDDSDCDATVVASECGPYPSLLCNGDITQTPSNCSTSCSGDSDCDANAYCNPQNQCEFDEDNGSICSADSQCDSGHCENGFCCANGDCCFDNSDCSLLSVSPVCDSQSSCQGHRIDGVCSASFECSAQSVDDDVACSGLPSNDCGVYLGVSCNSNTSQPTDQAGQCSSNCTDDNDCDASAHCSANECVPDTGPGGFCSEQSECAGGLICVDSVCCSSACTGSCQACDLVGSTGTCSSVADDQDPDAECGAVDCDGFYFGWQGDTCFEKADVTAAGATCDGSGSCATTADECSAHSARGDAQITCDSTCQEPNLSTCSGSTSGTCTDLDLGTETCGTGVCQVTTDVCNAGLPQSCIPDAAAASAEVCDGIDNDCNGSIDDGLATDSYEQNNSCESHFFLGLLGENLTESYSDMTLYTAGDEDWYRQKTTEDFTTCTEGVDEEYRYEINLTPPTGKDYDLELCYNTFTNSSCSTDCFDSRKGGDQEESIVVTWSGPCGGGTNDGLNFFIRVYPFQSASSCETYTLSTSFTKTN